MTLLTKLGIATLGGGSLAAGGYGVYELARPKNIGQQLKWEGFILMVVDPKTTNTEEDTVWTNLYKKYSFHITSNANDKFKKIEGNESDPTINNGTTLKNHCGKVFSLPLENKENLSKAKLWCVKNSQKLTSSD